MTNMFYKFKMAFSNGNFTNNEEKLALKNVQFDTNISYNIEVCSLVCLCFEVFHTLDASNVPGVIFAYLYHNTLCGLCAILHFILKLL